VTALVLAGKGDRVTAILTLLFVGKPGEVGSPFLPPLRAAASRLLVERRREDIKVLLLCEPVDAIILDEKHLQDSVVTGLKSIAPRTPVIVLRRRSRLAAIKPPAIAAVCCVDPRDKKLLNAMPIFLGFILGKRTLNFRNHTPVQSG
jgi:hypothetical protein